MARRLPIESAAVSVELVDFYGDDIRSWQEEADGKVYVVLRDPCLALGINPDGQARRLQRDGFFQRHIQHHQRMAVMIGHGATRYDELLGLDLAYLPMALASIDTNRMPLFQRDKFFQRHLNHRRMSVIVGYGHDVRFVIDQRTGEEWLNAGDCCDILGISNVGNALSRLKGHHKCELCLTDIIGRPQSQWFINEPGFYHLAPHRLGLSRVPYA
jgi:prophage antirepressor-like protein